MLYKSHGCYLISDIPLVGVPVVPAVDLASRLISIRAGAPLVNYMERLTTSSESERLTPWQRGKLRLGRHSLNIDFLSGNDGFVLRFVGVADFSVSFDGQTIVHHSGRNSDPTLVQDLLLGPIFAFSLALQGVFPLHGSAAVFDGVAIGLVGAAGYGKSSLMATCVSRGWRLLSDGLLVVLEHDQAFWGQPGNPAIRLRPDAATYFVGRSAFFRDFSTVEGTEAPKVSIEVGDGWGAVADGPHRLAGLYVLDPRDEDQPPDLAECTGWEAVQAVLVNTYTVQMHPESLLVPHFQFVSRLLDKVQLKRLRYHPKLAVLPEMFNIIHDDVCQMAYVGPGNSSAIEGAPQYGLATARP